MTHPVTLPLWLFVLIVVFAAVTFASHFLFPSVRWFFRRRLERAVAQLNTRLARPIQPFKLARRYDTIERLIYDPEVVRAVVAHAEVEGVPESVAFEKARGYAREIVPRFSASAYFGFAIRVARWLANQLYDVRVAEPQGDVLAEVPPEAAVVFVMNHRSNMDYVLVTYLVGNRSALAYAVGEWAQVWPLSGLIRAMGAYFIRRRSRTDLYRAVLARYIKMATQAGETQAFFPEGGLSLDGRLAAPKVGLLKYIVAAYRPGGRQVVFVPVALNYDRVLEDGVLTAAHRAGERRFGAPIGRVVRAGFGVLGSILIGRFKGYGRASVAYGVPLSLSAADLDEDVEVLAARLMDRIAAAMPVPPVPLVARAVLEAGGRLPRAEVEVLRHDVAPAIASLLARGLLAEVGAVLLVVPEARDLLVFYAHAAGYGRE